MAANDWIRNGQLWGLGHIMPNLIWRSGGGIILDPFGEVIFKPTEKQRSDGKGNVMKKVITVNQEKVKHARQRRSGHD